MKKLFVGILAAILLPIVIYLAGPRPQELNVQPNVELDEILTKASPHFVSQTIHTREAKLAIKPGNNSLLYWADSVGYKTNYVLLYLHGFSASPQEGQPICKDFARRYGMNMYAPLLADHGLVEEEPMLYFTAERYLQSAKEAFKIASLMGDSVIIMSTSTGSTASLFLASGDNDIHSLICYSPNIRVFDQRASLLAGPWGLQISRLVKGGNYNIWEGPAGVEDYWHTKYRLEAVVEMQRLLEGTMTKETFEHIECPAFIGYYYKNEDEQDDVVSVPHILAMYDQLSSPKKKKVALPRVGGHALASALFSKDIEGVKRETNLFAEEVLGIKLVSTIWD